MGLGHITDVAGVLVGHAQRRGRGWRTGTTVIRVDGGAMASCDVRGGGPGTRETDLLDPMAMIERVQAICLSGGSAYGLAAADGVMRWHEEHHLGFPVGPDSRHVVPIVPAAVIFDLGRGGDFTHRPDDGFGYRACASARCGGVAMGAVGAGTGANPVFYVTLGSGVGGGLVVDGRIYHGRKPGEAEIGHVRLDRAGTIVESRCSGWAVDARIRRLGSNTQPEHLCSTRVPLRSRRRWPRRPSPR